MKKGPLSLLFGLLGGTVLGMLYAPGKGKDFRKKMKEERQKGGTGLKTLKKEFQKMGEEMGESAVNLYESEKVQNAVEGGKQKLKSIATEAKEELNQRIEMNPELKKLHKSAKKKIGKAKGVLKKVENKAKKIIEKMGIEDKKDTTKF